MSTRPNSKGVVTANTGDQLKSKTWAELAKWHARCITAPWFEVTALSIQHRSYPKTWRVDAQTCREENSEAFAGLHAADSTPWYLFDEASAVPDKIWEVANGGLTDGQPMHIVFGNPTRSTGYFYQCFKKFKHRWITRQIDSRTAKMTNKKEIDNWIDDYGIDSDYVRVRVLGKFPKADESQFMPSDLVRHAMTRPDARYLGDDPLICGMDWARGGGDNCVFVFRRGFDGRSESTYIIPEEKSRDSMVVISKVAAMLDRLKPDICFADVGGIGGPINDRLRQLGYPVVDVGFGHNADEEQHWSNKTTEMGVRLRNWLYGGGTLPDDDNLEEELTTREYGHDNKHRLVLESKKDMKKRLGYSPDRADAWKLTFAQLVPPRVTPRNELDDLPGLRQSRMGGDYNPIDFA